MGNRLVVAKREGQRRRLKLADVKLLYTERIKKKKSSTVWHRELYSIVYDKPKWKRVFKKKRMYM